MIQKVVFPSFRENEYSQYDMRQLVSALELRFQALESNVEGFFPSVEDDGLDDRYALAVHTHVVADITDFNDNIPSSIFDLDDVSGSPAIGEGLIWSGTEFVTGSLGGSFSLDDLLDVNAASPTDGQSLVWDAGTLRWMPSTISGGGSSTLFALTDTDIASQLQGDLLFNVDGTEWQPSGTNLQWINNQYIQLGNEISLNWYDPDSLSVELAILTTGSAATGELPDLSGATYDSVSGTTDLQPEQNSYVLSDDGLILTTGEITANRLHNWSLGTAFDITTINTTKVSSSVVFGAGPQYYPTGIRWTHNGTVLWRTEYNTTVLTKETITTPYDITELTVTPDQTLDVNLPVNQFVAFDISLDGLHIVAVDAADNIRSYTMTVPYDLTTASFVGNRNLGPNPSACAGVVWSGLGDRIWVLGDGAPATVFQWNLSVPWDVSTATFDTGETQVANNTTEVNESSLQVFSDRGELYIGWYGNPGVDDCIIEKHTFTPIDPGGIPSTFIVGDPAYPTKIEGLTTNITSASTDIDGALNVDGAVNFASTLLVDGVATTHDITIRDPANTYSTTLAQVASGWLEFQPNAASAGFGIYLRETDILGLFTETGSTSSPPVAADTPNCALALFGETGVENIGWFGFSLTSELQIDNYIRGADSSFGVTDTAGVFDVPLKIVADDDYVTVRRGWKLRISDALDTDWSESYHDGTDFNTDHTNTANWNVNDIVVFNLRDSLLRLTDVGNATLANYSLVNDALGFSGTGVTQFNISGLGSLRLLGSTTLDIREGSSFTMRGSTVGNNVAFSHDNTDFNTNFVNTANWNLTGLTQLVLPSVNDQSSPTLTFGDRNTGFYEQSDNVLAITIGGGVSVIFDSTFIVRGDGANEPALRNVAAGAATPTVVPDRGNQDTGLGAVVGQDAITVIAGGVEGQRYTEAASHVIADSEIHTGITAGTTQTQAGGFQLLSSHNEVSTVATANDTVVAPLAVSGRVLTILNNGANTLQIFPAVGDDIGAGVNAAITLVAGGKLWFVAYNATTWTLFSQTGADQYAAPTAAFGLTNASGVQSALPAAIDTFTLLPNSTYEFEGTYIFATGTTSKTIALAFALTGAVVTNINYTTVAWNGTAGALSTTQRSKRTNTVSSTVVTQANTSVATVVTFRGIMRVTTGGTVVPQINFSAAPGGTNQMGIGSYVKFSRLGSDTDQTTGGWA